MTQQLRTALSILIELAELELECPACPNPPEGFHEGLKEAVQVTRAYLGEIRPPVGRWFPSAGQSPPTHRSLKAEAKKIDHSYG